MPRKGFPQIASMPSIRKNTSIPSDDIHLRSIETENLNALEATRSPYSPQLPEVGVNLRSWTQISISSQSSDEDEKKINKLDQSLQGETFMIVLLTNDKNVVVLNYLFLS